MGVHQDFAYDQVSSLPPSQYADPVADLLDKNGTVFTTRLFRESCVYHKGNYVKVREGP